MKKVFLLILSWTSLFSAVTVHNSGVNLGEPRVYRNYKGENTVEMTLIRLGQRSDKTVLIHFNVPGHAFHKKSFVYDEKCETTRCDKIFFTQKGGSMINLIADHGYWGSGLQALLPGEDRKVSLYFDEKLSGQKSRISLFKEYLNGIYRNLPLPETQSLLQESIQNFNTVCESNAVLKTNISLFKETVQTNLLGMGKPMLDQISNTCTDPMYKEILQMIKKVTFEPSDTYQKMVLTKTDELIIYLSPDLHNPAVTAKHALDEL